MRNRATSSFLVMKDLFIATALVAPSKKALEAYDAGVFKLHEGNLRELVWIALNRYSPQEETQKSYPLCIPDKIPFSTQDLSSTAPESLCQLDIMAFFFATVKCASSAHEERCKLTRFDQHQPRLLPACFSGQLCTEAQCEWWDSMYRFCHNTARDQIPKLRLVIQKGLETVRLGGTHGVSVALILHLAKTFDERVKELRALELQDGDKLHAFERRAAHYWEEAMMLLSRMERKVNIALPKDRLFIDDRPMSLDENQIKYLIEQSKFSLATVAMREGRLEEAREQFLRLKLPWASYNLSKIYRQMADEVMPTDDETTNQKLALVEQALDALYQTLDRIQAEKNHELHRVIPNDIDECVCEIENLRRAAHGISVVDSVSRYEDANEDVSGSDEGDTPSYGTPRASEEVGENSVRPDSPLSAIPFSSSTPAVKKKSPAKSPAKVNFSFSEQVGRTRASPERLEARLYALEAKQQTTLDMMSELKEQLKELRLEQTHFRELEKRMMDHILLCRPPLHSQQPYIPPTIPPPPPPITQQPYLPPVIPTPPNPYSSQLPPLPTQYSYPPAASWAQSSYSYPQSLSPIPGGGPMSNRRQFGRAGQMRAEYEEDLHQFGEDLYIDDGSQPLPSMCADPQQQLVQEWPFANKTGVEGKSTITYAPQTTSANRMPQSGFLANTLRGQSIQYFTTAQEQKPMPGPGFFSSPKPEAPPSASVIAQALAKSVSPSVTPVLSLAGQPTPSISTGLSATAGSTMPLFGSLMAASKSPDKVLSGEPASQGDQYTVGKFSFTSTVSGSASTGSALLTGANTASPSGVLPSQSASVPNAFTGFGAKPQVPSSSALGGTSVFSFNKPAFGATTTTASSETSAGASPFSSFTGFGSPGLQSFSGLASKTEQSDKTSSIFGKPTTPTASPVKPTDISSHSTPSQSPRKRNDSATMEEYEPNVDFKPVIDLPDLVEVKSGEEDEEVLFCQRAKLFRFDADTKQWKERGIGEMKILKHRSQKRSRIMMRRDQVLKLCANHQISRDLKLSPMANSDKTWCWVANDYSDEELKVQKLAVRFKTTELAENFKEVFEKCQSEAEDETETTKPQAPKQKVVSEEKPVDGKQMSLKEMFKPKEGTWVCQTCAIPNSPEAVICVACSTGKPGVDPKTVKEAVKKSIPKTQKPSLAEMFKPKAGSWSCDGCLIQNDGDKLRCVACNTLKPGVNPEDVKEEKKSGGFQFGSQPTGKSGFTFGGNAATSAPATGGFVFGPSTTATSTAATGGFVFGSPSTTKTDTAASKAGGGFVFGTPTTSTTVSTTSTSSAPPTGGFTFGTAPVKTASADSTSTQTSQPSTVSSTPGTPSKPAFSLGTTKTEATSSTPASPGFPFGTSASKATGSSESCGFNFGGVKTTGFSFGGQPSTEDKKETSEPKVTSSSGSGFNFGETKNTGFSFGTPSSKTVSTSDKNENNEDKSKSVFGTPSSSGFAFGQKSSFNFGSKSPEQKPDSSSTRSSIPKPVVTSETNVKSEEVKSAGFQFSKEPAPFGASSSGNSGFQFQLDSSTTTSDKKDSPFKFTFSPSKSASTVPKSPEIDKDGMYINKDGEDDHIYFEPVIQLPDKVDVVTGEEDENVLFEHRAKLFRFHNKEWKERGLGDIKVLENKATKKIRVLMRREQILKICCNHYVTDKLDLKPMPNSNGKAWTWFAMDYSDDEPKCEQFSVRFKTPEIANKFNEAIDNAKNRLSGKESTERTPESPASSRPPVVLQSLLSEDDDVIYVKKETATPAQVEMAKKFKLPDHFYLYENAPPCPGCIGCEDYKEGTKITPKTKSPSPKKKQDEVSKTTGAGSSSFGGAFGAPAAPSGGLFSSLAAGGGDSKETTGLFGQPQSSAGGIFGGGGGSTFSFSGIAASADTKPTAFQKDASKPFSWSGAGQKLFGQEEGEEEGDEVAQGEDPHFEPVVPLPDLVEVKTGEEDYEKLFCHRAKLFRYDKDTKQWKEKGIGEMKILQHLGTGQYRLLLRREQVYKLACNQWLTPDLKFQPMQTSETAWCWVGQDFSDNEAKLEQLAVKFKSIELAKEFKAKIDECQKNLVENPPAASANNNPAQPGTTSQGSQEDIQIYVRDAGSDDKDDEEYDDEEDDDEEDYDDVEEILLEKRVTFQMMEGNQWQNKGTGVLRVIYDDDVNANKVTFTTDKKEDLCNHLIAMESIINLDKSKHFCEWHPIDFATDEPIRRGFRAIFSSVPAAEEFYKSFQQGCTLARDSEISERDMVPRELLVPEAYGRGANDE